jgi:hypothetical protein
VFQRRGLDELSGHEPFPLTRRNMGLAAAIERLADEVDELKQAEH